MFNWMVLCNCNSFFQRMAENRKWQKSCPACTGSVNVRVNTCPFCQYDFHADRVEARKKKAEHDLAKGLRALKNNNTSRILDRIFSDVSNQGDWNIIMQNCH